MEKEYTGALMDILGRMCLETHLERDKALKELTAFTKAGIEDATKVKELSSSIPHLVNISSDPKWEARQAALHALNLYISILPQHFIDFKVILILRIYIRDLICIYINEAFRVTIDLYRTYVSICAKDY